MKTRTRKLKVSVISDLHLATHASKAKELLRYLKSINPEILVLNGDIIDSWRFSRNYFPKPHLKIIRHFIKMLENGVKLFYVTGNHDEFLRKFNGSEMGNLKIVNQLVLELEGKKTWIFHGDIFDNIIHRSKKLAKFGAAAYGLLTLLNKGVNYFLKLLGRREIVIYRSLKKKLIQDKPQPSKFELAISKVAAQKDYHTVICGHTHIPKDKTIINEHGIVNYINCGDWVENMTAAEYENGRWSLVQFSEFEDSSPYEDFEIPDEKEVYQSLMRELAII